jgi:hypothetical protein
MTKKKLKDKCSHCGSTKSKLFWDFDDGSVLCDKCNEEIGDNWSSIHNKKDNSESLKKLSFISLGFFLMIIIFLVVKLYFFTCPVSCDDDNNCTINYCSSETNFKCITKDIIPCLGNDICEEGEYGTADCPDCDDNNYCTKNYINYENLECINEPIIPCLGNDICEEGEYGTADCPDCDDNNYCTKNYINYENLECINEPIIPCCGNGIIEKGETCSSCPKDVKCPVGTICCFNICKELCTKDSDCLSNNSNIEGNCIFPYTCNSKCEYNYKSSIYIKNNEYTIHGFKFNVNLEQYGNEINYKDLGGRNNYLNSQENRKLLKYRVSVQCIEEDCKSIYSSSFSLMDNEGYVYNNLCPLNHLGQCNNQDGINSIYSPLKNQKTSGILIFSIPSNVNEFNLVYKFSKYMDNPNNLIFITELN